MLERRIEEAHRAHGFPQARASQVQAEGTMLIVVHLWGFPAHEHIVPETADLTYARRDEELLPNH